MRNVSCLGCPVDDGNLLFDCCLNRRRTRYCPRSLLETLLCMVVYGGSSSCIRCAGHSAAVVVHSFDLCARVDTLFML